jgi:hypothetical protein
MSGLREKVRFGTLLMGLLMSLTLSVLAQVGAPKSQEVSDSDGQPVLLKHLPEYETVRANAVFSTDGTTIKQTVNSPVLDAIEFPVGTEAVSAEYPAGRLVIIEYTNPQASVQADSKIQQFLASQPQPSIAYRRIGNYNAFVFGVSDGSAAVELLDQVKYEKSIQWLGEDPYLLKRIERYMITTSRDIMISTVLVIVGGLATSVVIGIFAGFIFFRVRDQKRESRTAFSDAGGLTRLNLDGLSEEL